MSFGLRQSFGRLCKQEAAQRDWREYIARQIEEEFEEDPELFEECRKKILDAARKYGWPQ